MAEIAVLATKEGRKWSDLGGRQLPVWIVHYTLRCPPGTEGFSSEFGGYQVTVIEVPQ